MSKRHLFGSPGGLVSKADKVYMTPIIHSA